MPEIVGARRRASAKNKNNSADAHEVFDHRLLAGVCILSYCASTAFFFLLFPFLSHFHWRFFRHLPRLFGCLYGSIASHKARFSRFLGSASAILLCLYVCVASRFPLIEIAHRRAITVQWTWST